MAGPQTPDRLPTGDVGKLALARVIRARTALPNAWLAKELAIGHPTRLNHRRSRHESEILAAAARLEDSARF